jgi:shikimate 5-dehydrogenase
VGLERTGAAVTLFNRSSARGARAAAALALPLGDWSDFAAERFDLVVHATPLGRAAGDPLPFDVDRLAPEATVVDLVYGERPTALAAAVERRGGLLVDGRQVLWHQARGQYRRMTGRPLPRYLEADCLRERP